MRVLAVFFACGLVAAGVGASAWFGLLPAAVMEMVGAQPHKDNLRLLMAVRARECQHLLRVQRGPKSDSPFSDVPVCVALPDSLLVKVAEQGEGARALVAPKLPRAPGEKCVVYGIGIANSIEFEVALQKYGCEVFAFDCTSDEKAMGAAAAAAGVKFFPWCIGRPQSFENNVYTRGQGGRKYQFRTLSEVMTALGHTRLSILKFDIEGFEWQLFRNEILPLANPPDQLVFELHAEGVTPLAVPPKIVAGKSQNAVNRLFAKLHERGYLVTSKMQNPGDTHACDFTLLLA
jgi:hypothetical protein